MQGIDSRQITPHLFPQSSSAYATAGVQSSGLGFQTNSAAASPPTKMGVFPQVSSFGTIVATIKEIVSMVVKVVEMVANLIGGTFRGAPQEGGVMSSTGAIVSGEKSEGKGGGIFDKITPYISKGVSFAKDIFGLFSSEDKTKEGDKEAQAASEKESSGGFFDTIKSLGSSLWGGIKSVGSSLWDGIKGIGSFFGSL